MGTIIIAGLGPGTSDDVTPAVQRALASADAVVGYKYYFQFVEPYLKAGCQCIDTGMKRERDRAEQAFRLAEDGQTVVVISSGDAGTMPRALPGITISAFTWSGRTKRAR